MRISLRLSQGASAVIIVTDSDDLGVLGRLSSLELLQGFLVSDLFRCSGSRLGLLSFLGFSTRFLSIDSISVLSGLSSGILELFIVQRLFVHELCVLGLIDDSLYVCL